jgi:prepilin-type N-terminal cleavage/methylation domain-containing protein
VGKSIVKESTRGFSLLELVVVVAIILIIATIALPRLIRSWQATREASAVALIRTLNSVENTFISSNQGTFGTIPALITAGMIDSRFAGSISGYTFTLNVSGNNYTVTATPTSVNSGRFGYYSAPDAVIRYQSVTSTNCTPCYPPNLPGEPVQ